MLTGPGADFGVGGGTTVTVQVQDAGGNLVAGDSTTQVTFSPTGSAAITGVNTGAGDDVVDIRSGESNTILTVDTGADADTIEVARTGSSATTTIQAGEGADAIRVYGKLLNSDVTVRGGDPLAEPGDTLVFVAGQVAPEQGTQGSDDYVRVPGKAQVNYREIEQLKVFALSDPDAGTYAPIPEGSNLRLSADASAVPPGRNIRYDWDIDDDGTYGDRTGRFASLTWADLVGFSLGDDGDYTVSVRLTDVTAPFGFADSDALIGQETVAFSTFSVENVKPFVNEVAATPTVENDETTLSGAISDPVVVGA